MYKDSSLGAHTEGPSGLPWSFGCIVSGYLGPSEACSFCRRLGRTSMELGGTLRITPLATCASGTGSSKQTCMRHDGSCYQLPRVRRVSRKTNRAQSPRIQIRAPFHRTLNRRYDSCSKASRSPKLPWNDAQIPRSRGCQAADGVASPEALSFSKGPEFLQRP